MISRHIVPGMLVKRPDCHTIVTLHAMAVRDHDGEWACRILDNGKWRSLTTIPSAALLGEYSVLLGCDPDIASREDCALYGIAPGIDAGAHGFARLRDGGALDLREPTTCNGAVLAIGDRREVLTYGAGNGFCLNDGARFIGLDGRYARPEDVRRLCCGLADSGCVAGSAYRCTLALGHGGDEHEDIANGARWRMSPRVTP